MADQEADVIRLEVPTQAEITGGTPPAVKLKQQIHALDTGRFFYKNSAGVLVPFLPETLLASQDSASLGTGLIGDSGIPGVTPEGAGSPGAPANLHAMLLGIKAYVDAQVAGNVLVALFDEWDAERDPPYEANELVYFYASDTGSYYVAISNQGGNSDHDPIDAISEPNEWWTVYGYSSLTSAPLQKPLAQIITMILNTKANA